MTETKILTTQRQIRPDAIGLGCRRCASSWLHAVLNQHPAIGKTKHGGLHYFSKEWSRGPDWYREQLADSAGKDKIVEFSVSYAYPEYSEQVARRIYDFSPEVRLFASVRNPIDRAFSDFLRSTRVLDIPGDISFEDALEDYPQFIDRGMYGRILAPFFDLFPKENITILFYDDLKEGPETYLRPLFRLLDVEPRFEVLDLKRKEPSGKKVRNAWLNGAVFAAKAMSDAVLNRLCYERWQSFKARNVHHYSRLISANTEAATMSMETRLHLLSRFESDIRQLELLTKRRLEHWK